MDEGEPSPQVRALPLLPLCDDVVFPGTTHILLVDRPCAIAALQMAVSGPQTVVIACQRKPSDGVPGPGDIHDVGTVCRILQLADFDDGTSRITVEGLYPVKIKKFVPVDDGLEVRIKNVQEKHSRGKSVENLNDRLMSMFAATIRLEQEELARYIPAEGEEYTPRSLYEVIRACFHDHREALEKFEALPEGSQRWECIGEFLQDRLIQVRPEKYLDAEQEPRFPPSLVEGESHQVIENLFVTCLKEEYEVIAEPLREAREMQSPGQRAYFIADILPLDSAVKQTILQSANVEDRIARLCDVFMIEETPLQAS